MVDSEHGYTLVAADGGVLAFGDAPYFGSSANATLSAPVVSLMPTRTNRGYVLVTGNGSVIPFGDAPFGGSAQGLLTEAVGIVGVVG
jgi:hypothetical protein